MSKRIADRIYDNPQFTVGVVLEPEYMGKTGYDFIYQYQLADSIYTERNFKMDITTVCGPMIMRYASETVGDTFLVVVEKGKPGNSSMMLIDKQYELLGVEPLPASKHWVRTLSKCEKW